MRPMLPASLTHIVILAATACGGGSKSSLPAASSPPSAPPVPFVTSLTIAGQSSFSTIGETSQLTATAHFSDATTKDITTEGLWASTDPSVTTVSSGGLVTVVAFGKASAQVSYDGRTVRLPLSATPPGTLIVAGRVREPGLGGVGAVRVVETTSGASTLTAGTGEFSLAAVPKVTTARLEFAKEGYEIALLEAPPDSEVDMPLQRTVRLTTGQSVTVQLAPHDMSYLVAGVRCFPCRLIRVVNPAPGTLQLRLTWSGARALLHLWAGGHHVVGALNEAAADVSVGTGELIVHVGMLLPATATSAPDYVPFTLATSFRPGP